MAARIRSHIRSNLVGSLALLLALTGGTTAYAIDGSLPGQNTVGSEDIINNEVKSSDIANGRIFDVDIADNAITSEKVKGETLTGSDVNESTLNGAAIPGLGHEARIHESKGLTFCTTFSPCLPRFLLPGLAYWAGCGHDGMGVTFYTKAGGTANAMIVASGVDPGPSTNGDFNVKNGPSAQGTVLRDIEPYHGYEFNAYFVMNDGTGFANAESRFVIDAGDKTYSVELHTFHRATDDNSGTHANCDIFGTAIVAR